MTDPLAKTPHPEETVVRRGLFRRLLKNPLGVTALIILLVVLVAAIVGDALVPFDPNRADLANAFLPPGGEHLLGTDSAGRDVFARLLAGARITLLAAALAAVVAVAIALPTGLLAGYYTGRFDSVASWFTNVTMALPSIVVLLAVSAALGKSVWITMTALGVLMTPGLFRLTRNTVRAVRNELYVDAARVAGVSTTSIIGRHILTVVRAPAIIQVSVICGISISVQAGLDFLGVGDPLIPSWGLMLNEGFRNIYSAPLLALWPGLAISLTVGAFVLLGNALRDVLEDAQTVKLTKKQRAQRAPMTKPLSLADMEAASEDADHLLVVSGLGVGYPRTDGTIKTVVEDVSFYVDRGEVLGLVGESGSGKSQTAFSILGLLPDEAEIAGGRILFDGVPLVSAAGGRLSESRMSQLRGRRIAYIPQEPMSNLDPNFTIGYQLTRPLVKVLGKSKAEARERALQLLEVVGINDPKRTFDAYPHEISGGMAQRVLIAGAVSCDPDLLIADEPTTALDVTVQAEILDLLRDMQSRFDLGVLLVTHNFGVVADICDRVVVMQTGAVVESGTTSQIIHQPTQPYTKDLLSAMLAGTAPMTTLVPGAGSETEVAK